MKTLVFFLFSFLYSIQGNNRIDRRLPPKITEDLQPTMFFRRNQRIELKCNAVGVPRPDFRWFKDDEPFKLIHGNQEIINKNVLIIRGGAERDNGSYYCMAHNNYGEACTNTTLLLMAHLIATPGKMKNITVKESESVKIECDNIKSLPNPSYTWVTMAIDQNTKEKKQIATDKRIAIDDDGALHFSHTYKSDEKVGQKYSCQAFNAFSDVTQGTGYAIIRVLKSDKNPIIRPSLLFASGERNGYKVIALLNEKVKLSCFFRANPECTYSWKRVGGEWDGRSLGMNQISLTLDKVVEADQGTYRCTCTSPNGTAQQDISLIVQWRPMWKFAGDLPTNQNVTEGDSAYFNCKPYANPIAVVQWRKNGKIINEMNLESRWSMNHDMSQLVIRQVCKDCLDRFSVQSDLGVIQCDVSNKHGDVTYSAYLNVIKRTELTSTPKGKTVLYEDGESEVTFECSATTDPITPLSLRWLFLPKAGTFPENIHFVDGKILLSDNNETLVMKVQNSTEWPAHEGTYTCLADNGYSRQNSTAELVVVMPTTQPPIVDPTTSQAGIQWWWLLLVIAVLLLLLLLLVCCCCLWREKGGVYKVDQKERRSGNDPENELKEDGFHDYQRPSTDFLKGSRGSLGSSIPMNSDDEGSLNEYGDIDAGKFGEDGSFIGDYSTENRNKNRIQGNNSHSNGNGVSKANVFSNNTFGPNGYQRV